jgi:hypothetical protein
MGGLKATRKRLRTRPRSILPSMVISAVHPFTPAQRRMTSL